MQSAGFTEMRSHPPIQNFAIAPKLRCQAEHPHFVYSLLGADLLLESNYSYTQFKLQKNEQIISFNGGLIN
jgi:hypothetical protein